MTKLYQDPFGPSWRMNWFRMLLTWEASIFQFFWPEWLAATLFCAVCVVAVYFARKDTDAESLNLEFQSMVKMFDFLADRFQAAIGLMLGFYTNAIYNRWWNVRTTEGSCQGGIANVSVAVGTMIREIKGEDVNVVNIRMQLIRWANLAHALQVGNLYEKKPNEFASLERLKEIGLMTEPEYEWFLEHEQSRYVAPLVWFTNLLSELKEKELCGVDSATVKLFFKNIALIRGGLGGLGLYASVPIPLSYRQLANFTVRSYMVLILLNSVLQDVADQENLGGLTNGSFWLIIAFSFEYFLFVGWLSLADALGNPFRHWADEFQWENYVSGMLAYSVVVSSQLPSNSLSNVAMASKTDGEKTGEELLIKSEELDELITTSNTSSRQAYITGHYANQEYAK